MSFHSMTGFGKGEGIGNSYTVVVEIKSVNHRFKDFRFKMPSLFNSMEMELKKHLEKSFIRGSIDVFVSYKKDQTKAEVIEVDLNKVENYINSFKSVAHKLGIELSIQPTEYLKPDFYLENTTKESELLDLLKPAFETAVNELISSREEEGAKLIEKLIEHQQAYQESFLKISDLKNSYQEMVKEKLLAKFEKYGQDLKVDEPRFLQEVIYYLEKLDIEEEITRIVIHLQKLKSTLEEGSSNSVEVGRQLEFLLQELNRETNTIGSKSQHQEISQSVVQMKVQLEKIREQALNLQ